MMVRKVPEKTQYRSNSSKLSYLVLSEHGVAGK